MCRQFRPDLERMDSLVLPSVTIIEPTTYIYDGPWGTASVTVEVTQESDGLYHWEYDVTNVDYGAAITPNQPIGMFIIPLDVNTAASNISSTMGWDVYVGVIAGHDNAIGWFSGEMGPFIGTSGTAEFTFTTGADAPISGSYSEVSDQGYAMPSGSIMVSPTINLEYQNALKNALLDYADQMLTSVVQADGSNQSYDNSPTFQAIQTALAAKNPLSEAELNELEGLMKKPTAANLAQRNALMGRMQTDGIKFDGTNELQVLEKILEQGQKNLKKDPRAAFLGLYKQGVQVAINGLQVIDNVKYTQYKAARDGGAPHEEAWTWQFGGDTARRRYGLEKLYNKAN